jgi:hypothetical protein
MNYLTNALTVVLLLALSLMLANCNNTGAPDVSGIKVNTEVKRFEQYLFEKTDTPNFAAGMKQVQAAFPSFTNDFVTNILGLPYTADFSDTAMAGTISELKRFLRISRPLYESVTPQFRNVAWLEKDLNQSFKYVKYYFPSYRVPQVITYLGPFNAPGVAITTDALAIGLQLYAGKNFPFYTSTEGMEMFPLYISRRFEPQYIPVNCMKAVAEDIYQDKSRGRPLIEQMIETGKQWYLLEKFMPGAADSLKTGFTERQLSWCRNNEGLIWNFILQSNDLYSTEPAVVQTYIGESPSTQGMPDESPGNIGQWIGWQIVKKFASRGKDLKPDLLLKTDPKKIFSEAKYKPR